MLQFFANHWGTMLTGAIVLAGVAACVHSMRKKKKNGSALCSGDCTSCGSCHEV